MASKKVTIDNLQAALDEVLEEFANDVDQNLDDVINALADKGARALRSSSPVDAGAPQSGKYARGWAVDKSGKHRITHEATLYNRAAPGLAHLLEHGHALRQGGRSPAKVHIAPVEDMLEATFRPEDLVR